MKIYVIRHCESVDDVLNCYGGCADFELTEKGANDAAAHSIPADIKKIFSSPYKRAKNVAKIFSDKIGCSVEIIDDLREINTYGVMSGVNKDLAKEIFSLVLNSDEYKSYGYYKGKSFLGGEDVTDFDARIKNAFDYIAKQGVDTVAVITHGGVFRSVYKNVLNKPEKILEIDDLGTIEINYDNGAFTIANTTGIVTE